MRTVNNKKNNDNISGKPDGTSLELGSRTYVDYTRQLADKSPDNSRTVVNQPQRIYPTGRVKRTDVRNLKQIDGADNKSEYTEKTEEKNAEIREKQIDKQDDENSGKKALKARNDKIQHIEAEMNSEFSVLNPKVSIRSENQNMIKHFTDVTPSKKDDKTLKKIRDNGIVDTVDADVLADALNDSGNNPLKIQTEIVAGQVSNEGDKKTSTQLRNLTERFAMGIRSMSEYEEQIRQQTEKDKQANDEFLQNQQNNMFKRK